MSPRHDTHGRCLKAPLEQRIVGRDQYAVLSRPSVMPWMYAMAHVGLYAVLGRRQWRNDVPS